MRTILLSYTLAEAIEYQSLNDIYDSLITYFPVTWIFMGANETEGALEVFEARERSLVSCDVLIAVIGKGWPAPSAANRVRQLEDSSVFRFEIATALKGDATVIPVVLDGAVVPEIDQLADDLKPLAHINALKIGRARFEADIVGLVEQVDQILETANPELWRLEKDELKVWRLKHRQRKNQ
jgi:hypothetical protein